MMPKYLSKSNFMHWLIHPAYLWIEKHEKKRLPPITETDEFMFAKGHDFEAEARKLFPGGVMVEGKPWEFAQLTRQSQELIGAGTEVIFQATTLTERGLLARSDILKKNGEEWDLYEVKSSTRVKDDHLTDLAFQVIAWEETGIKIGNVYICYVDREYVRKGEVDPHQLVKQETVTASVRKQCPWVEEQIPKALATMEQERRPDLSPEYASSLNIWLPIYLHLHPDLAMDHPYRLAQIKPEDVGRLKASGAEALADIQDLDGFNERQQSQIRAWQKPPATNRTEIGRFLAELEFPLWFLDYETISHAIPLYEGTSPYQDIPFQYSLHKLEAPDAKVEHFEYIARDMSFPVPRLLEQLQSDLGEKGSVLVWYQNFEKTMNTRMGEFAPEYAQWLEQVNRRVVDLMIPFSSGWYIDKHFAGSASLKKVLPVLAPHLSYKELDVQDGGSAQAVWYGAVSKPGATQEKVFEDLLAYCKLDTLAMVEIYWFLLKMMEGEDDSAYRRLEQQQLF